MASCSSNIPEKNKTNTKKLTNNQIRQTQIKPQELDVIHENKPTVKYEIKPDVKN